MLNTKITTLCETNNSIVIGTYKQVTKVFKHPELGLDHQSECDMTRSILQHMGLPTRTSVQLFRSPEGIWTMQQPRFTCDVSTFYYEQSRELGWSSSLILPLLKDVYNALRHLWTCFGRVHGDVKPANIMVYFRGPVPRFVLWDYGAAVFPTIAQYYLGPNELMTLWYRAPERRVPQLYNQSKIDVWSMGVMTVELLGGLHLFQGRTMSDQFQICDSVRHLKTATSDGQVSTLTDSTGLVYPRMYIPLVKPTLVVNPSERPDIDGMLLVLHSLDMTASLST